MRRKFLASAVGFSLVSIFSNSAVAVNEKNDLFNQIPDEIFKIIAPQMDNGIFSFASTSKENLGKIKKIKPLDQIKKVITDIKKTPKNRLLIRKSLELRDLIFALNELDYPQKTQDWKLLRYLKKEAVQAYLPLFETAEFEKKEGFAQPTLNIPIGIYRAVEKSPELRNEMLKAIKKNKDWKRIYQALFYHSLTFSDGDLAKILLKDQSFELDEKNQDLYLDEIHGDDSVNDLEDDEVPDKPVESVSNTAQVEPMDMDSHEEEDDIGSNGSQGGETNSHDSHAEDAESNSSQDSQDLMDFDDLGAPVEQMDFESDDESEDDSEDEENELPEEFDPDEIIPENMADGPGEQQAFIPLEPHMEEAEQLGMEPPTPEVLDRLRALLQNKSKVQTFNILSLVFEKWAEFYEQVYALDVKIYEEFIQPLTLDEQYEIVKELYSVESLPSNPDHRKGFYEFISSWLQKFVMNSNNSNRIIKLVGNILDDPCSPNSVALGLYHLYLSAEFQTKLSGTLTERIILKELIYKFQQTYSASLKNEGGSAALEPKGFIDFKSFEKMVDRLYFLVAKEVSATPLSGSMRTIVGDPQKLAQLAPVAPSSEDYNKYYDWLGYEYYYIDVVNSLVQLSGSKPELKKKIIPWINLLRNPNKPIQALWLDLLKQAAL